MNEANEALLLLKKMSKQELKDMQNKNETFATDIKNREQVLQYEKGVTVEEIAALKTQKAEVDDKYLAAKVHLQNADKDSVQKDTDISILKKKIEVMKRQHKERKDAIEIMNKEKEKTKKQAEEFKIKADEIDTKIAEKTKEKNEVEEDIKQLRDKRVEHQRGIEENDLGQILMRRDVSARETALQDLKNAKVRLEMEQDKMRQTDQLVAKRIDRRVKEIAGRS